MSPAYCVNWLSAGFVTSVKDQGSCSACPYFSSTAASEFTFIKTYSSKGWKASNTDLSERDLMECMPGDGCKGDAAAYVLARISCNGQAFEKDKQYVQADYNYCPSSLTHYDVGMKGFALVPATTTALAQAVTKAVSIISVDATNWGLYKAGVYNCNNDESALNHAVTIVGYQNDVKMTSGQIWDMWLAKNSWGSKWGSNGYVYIRKGCSSWGPFSMFKEYPLVPILKYAV